MQIIHTETYTNKQNKLAHERLYKELLSADLKTNKIYRTIKEFKEQGIDFFITVTKKQCAKHARIIMTITKKQ